jgi:hypothetical protein
MMAFDDASSLPAIFYLNYASGVGRRRQRDHDVDRTSRDGVRSVEMAVFWGFRLLGR